MLVRIEGFQLPGRDCGERPGFPGYRNIHVGVQRRNRPQEIRDLYPGDAQSAVWDLEVTAKRIASGWDLLGPEVQGRPAGRFVYLAWGTVDDAGNFSMFRRAKLWFDGVAPELLAEAVRDGGLLARLSLTDGKGEPLCATVRPPLIEWSLMPEKETI
ncbi:DUF5990 family protein [Spirillospora sp. NPDC047279]|uniref:DUF5990 family protein n=1 Tax=Spirillospora sp. NPDC047279 TaxID=3155478 RepID=UPI003404DC08